MIDFFSFQKINPYMMAIKSKTGEIMYLIEGTKKSVLIDTCIGVKGLRDYVDRIRNNDNPLSVLISHGHIDHAMAERTLRETDSQIYRVSSLCRILSSIIMETSLPKHHHL